MSEGMKLSTKTEAAPIIATEGTGNGALQLLAEQYRRRLARIVAKGYHNRTAYYEQAEAAVRALYADAT